MASLAPASVRSTPGSPNATPRTEGLRRLLRGLSPVAVAILCVGTVAAAEFVTAHISLVFGVVFHITILFGLLSASALVSSPRYRAFFLAASIGPLIRIVSLGIPLGHFPQPYWYVLTAIPLFLATWLIAREIGLSRAQLNLCLPSRRTLPVDTLVALSGLDLGVVEWKILGVKPIIHGVHPWEIIGVAAVLLVCTGFLEELIFRGLVQHVATGFLGAWGGLFFMALLFAALHIGWESPLDLIFVFGVAMYFGVVVRYTRSLLGVTFAHGAINTMLFVIVPLHFHG